MGAGDSKEQQIREWQLRRLEVKEQMADQPERFLELSQVLDLMDEEHERIVNQSGSNSTPQADEEPEPAAKILQRAGLLPSPSHASELDFHVRVQAADAEGLRKLLSLALSELDGLLLKHQPGSPESVAIPGEMSGSMGAYQFLLKLSEQ